LFKLHDGKKARSMTYLLFVFHNTRQNLGTWRLPQKNVLLKKSGL